MITDKESSPSNGGRVHITLYGEHTKSDQIMLFAADPNKKTFEPGNIDQFTVDIDFYKIVRIMGQKLQSLYSCCVSMFCYIDLGGYIGMSQSIYLSRFLSMQLLLNPVMDFEEVA